MTPASLKRIGSCLYGPNWQTPLGAALGVTARTIRRWAVGHTGMPAMIGDELEKLAILRRREIEKMLAREFA
ncbi:MAG TPA: hypothetical protein VK641_13470 [Terriglobales bacterium]|nr:hypothetical protein [Terriglobales bacterium]